jgi:hypothetical protein
MKGHLISTVQNNTEKPRRQPGLPLLPCVTNLEWRCATGDGRLGSDTALDVPSCTRPGVVDGSPHPSRHRHKRRPDSRPLSENESRRGNARLASAQEEKAGHDLLEPYGLAKSELSDGENYSAVIIRAYDVARDISIPCGTYPTGAGTRYAVDHVRGRTGLSLRHRRSHLSHKGCDGLGGSQGESRIGADMSKSTRNSGKSWTATDKANLRSLAKGNTPTRVIGLKLGRTRGAVQSQASKQGTSLKPTNQSPYGSK